MLDQHNSAASRTDPLLVLWEELEARGLSPRGEHWKFTAACPAHDDRRPSLAVSEGADGRALIHCYAGCRTEAVVDALELRMADLFPAGHRNGHRRPPIVARAKAPAEALLAALDLIAGKWSGLISSQCPYCDNPALWWRIGPTGVDADCPDGCSRDEVLRALENAVWLAETAR